MGYILVGLGQFVKPAIGWPRPLKGCPTYAHYSALRKLAHLHSKFKLMQNR